MLRHVLLRTGSSWKLHILYEDNKQISKFFLANIETFQPIKLKHIL